MAKRKDLPRLERGKDLSRIHAFMDGVFAIAITLLVLQIDVPEKLTSNGAFLDELSSEVPDFFAFALSFAVIGMYWIGSHRFMRMVREYDHRLMALTLLYLAFIVLLPFSSQLIGEYGSDIDLVVVFYIVNLIAIAGSLALIERHVLKNGLADPDYEWDVKLSLKSTVFTCGVFAASIPFVFVLGSWTPLLWLLNVFDPYQRRRDRAYDEDSPGS